MGSKRNKRRKTTDTYYYEDDVSDINPRKGTRKLARRKNRHREKLDCKNLSQENWDENMEDYYDRN
jgi:hypothetical protein